MTNTKKNKFPLEFVEKLKETINIDLETEYKKVDENGKTIWLKKTIMPIYDKYIEIGKAVVNYDITDKKVLEKLAITDGLTGLYNRRYFNEVLNREISRATRKKSLLSFLMIDVDFFKQYNDSYGHDRGDKVLISISLSIQKSINRGSDFAFRLGGEEFGILFVGCDKKGSLLLAKKIKDNIEKLKIPHSNSLISDHITISSGLLVIDFKNETVDKNGFYTMADDALYQAKNKGRNRVVLHENDDLEFF
ncbi:MAG: GGDEF domain-containing protein [Campylobacteraceae bacterium]|nr:GGDEF domain-containing protein [Campylobacteraceae bacterium]